MANRECDEMEIQHQINRANKISREQVLESSGSKTSDRIPLVVTYHPDLPSLSRILCKHLPILYVLDRMKLVAPSPPLVANRRPRELKDLLTKATLKPSQHSYQQKISGQHGRYMQIK